MILSIHLIPNAKENEIVGWVGETLKVRICAPPIEGRANEELLKYLAKRLDLAPSEIDFVSGLISKQKRLKIPLAEEDVRHALT